MEAVEENRPTDLILIAHSKIRDYIFELENKLKNHLELENNYKELDMKYLDLQEDIFSKLLENNDQLNQISELKIENEKIHKQNDVLTERIKKLRIPNKSHLNDALEDCTLQRTSDADNATPTQSMTDDVETNNANNILVKGFPKHLLGKNPKKGFVVLGQPMQLKMTEADIRNVIIKERKFYERQKIQPDKLILIVEFNNQELKVNFLKYKEKLKSHRLTKDIEVTDYVSEDVYNLYQYAKILKSHGFALVYWRNNSVYAKKTRSTASQPILIKSESQVDVLKLIK